MDVERLFQLSMSLVAALGVVLVVLGALLESVTVTGLGLVAAVAGGALYRSSGRLWDWYWDRIERVHSGDIEPTQACGVGLVFLIVLVWTGSFVGLWWLAVWQDVVTNDALAGNVLSTATLVVGVVPGLALAGGLLAVVRSQRFRNTLLDSTNRSRALQLVYVTVLSTLGVYCLLLFVHPPSAAALAVTYVVSFVAGIAYYVTRKQR